MDKELIDGCQRYLDELEKRSQALDKKKEEQRQIEEQKAARREYWRKMLYDNNSKGVAVIVPENSQLDKMND